MVSADSDRVSRAPPYSGTSFESGSLSSTRLSRSLAPPSRGVRLTTGLVTLLLLALQPLLYLNRSQASDHRKRNPIRFYRLSRSRLAGLPLRYRRFGLFRFRSPLLSESRFLSFPPG